jgi:hypothetical protein
VQTAPGLGTGGRAARPGGGGRGSGHGPRGSGGGRPGPVEGGGESRAGGDRASPARVVPALGGPSYWRVQAPRGRAQETARATADLAERFVQAKRRELAVHLANIEAHEQLAALQEGLGHPERAAEARAKAERAREFHRPAAGELAEYLAQIKAVEGDEEKVLTAHGTRRRLPWVALSSRHQTLWRPVRALRMPKPPSHGPLDGHERGPWAPQVSGCGSWNARQRLRAFSLDNVTAPSRREGKCSSKERTRSATLGSARTGRYHEGGSSQMLLNRCARHWRDRREQKLQVRR